MISARLLRILVLAVLLLLVPAFVYISHQKSSIVSNVMGTVSYSDGASVRGKQFPQLSQGSGSPPQPDNGRYGDSNLILNGMKSFWGHVQSDAWLPKPKQTGAHSTESQQTTAAPAHDAKESIEDTVIGAYAPKMSNTTAREELGRATWKFLHTLTLRFPEKPTQQQSNDLKEFFRLFSLLYPCGDCAVHFQQLLKEMPPQAASRKNAALWLSLIHI